MARLEPAVIEIKANLDRDSLRHMAQQMESLAQVYDNMANAARDSAAKIRAMTEAIPDSVQQMFDGGTPAT